jgi:two-component system, NtrC family, sensor histidine kinase HydH
MWNRIIGPTVLVVFCWLAFAGVVAMAMYWIAQFHSQVVAETGITIQAANSMSDTLWESMALVVANRPSSAERTKGNVARLEKRFEHCLVQAEETSFTETEKEISRAIRQKYTELRRKVHERLSSAYGSDTSVEASDSQLLASADSIAGLCRELREFNEGLAEADVTRQGRMMTFIVLAFLGILLVGTVAGVLWSIHTATEVDSSVSQISISLVTADSQLKEELGCIGLDVSGNLEKLRAQVELVADRIRQVVSDLHRERHKSIVASRLAVAGELAAGVAHEIRNPLTAVKLLLHAAAENTPDRSLSERQFDVIQSEIARIEKIVQGLLDFARPPQGNRLPHDLRSTITGAIQLTAGLADQHGVVVQPALPCRPVPVNADPSHLHQVFVNLMMNAIEAMPEGGCLHVGIELDDARQRACYVRFADSGPGIPAQIADRLFEPFVTSKKSGTGLGLAVSSRLVQEQGGHLTAENRPEGGAVLTVELPISTATETRYA